METEAVEQEETATEQPPTTTTPEQQLVIVEGMLDRIFGGKDEREETGFEETL
tara:strand:+ start:1272 stop:1430 length:159 start_codon:yes stop_codon:yes gene_type:complete